MQVFQASATASSVVLLLALLGSSEAIHMDQCDFVNALRNYSVPEEQIPTWTCIVNYESHFDTAAYNPSSGDYGIFQISQIYWCTSSGAAGNGCNKRCVDFLNDDIKDDLSCARQIWNEFNGRTGDGFSAWAVYPLYCQGDNSGWVGGC